MSALEELSAKRRRIDRPRKNKTDTSEPALSADAARDLFRKHFEQSFAPLPQDAQKSPESLDADEEGDDSEDLLSNDSGSFGGFDSDSEGDGVIVVEHRDAASADDPSTKIMSKAFMSSAPPRPANPNSTKSTKGDSNDEPTEEDQATEALNLKNDLELQRLINESHLLDPTKQGSSKGQRQRITDLRIQGLGSKRSILQQEKMPMAHRKGIQAKKTRVEKQRRQEAKENGIVLEKVTRGFETAGGTSKANKRERGVGGPGLGKFKGGTLTLSKRDLASLSTRHDRGKGRGGKRKR